MTSPWALEGIAEQVGVSFVWMKFKKTQDITVSKVATFVFFKDCER